MIGAGGGSGRWLARVLACCVTGLVGAAAAGLVGLPAVVPADASSPISVSGSGAPSSLGSALVIAGSPGEGEQAWAAERAKLASPEAMAAREASRTKFEHLNVGQAAKVAGVAFPGVIDRLAGGPPQLPAGQHITGYLTDNAASVSIGGGKQAVVESIAPIAVQNSRGQHIPVDLSLSNDGGSFHPVTPIVGVSIPTRLSDGVALAGTGVSLTPVDAQGTPLGGSAGVVDGSSVLYANTQTDTDSLVKPTTEGFAADTLLRSVDSPRQLFFKVGLPKGASLVQARNGSGAVEVVKDSVTVATILAPGAQDAAGTAVPVSMSISGDTLVLSVADHAAEYQYPVEVDPEVLGTDLQLIAESNANGTKRSNWEFYQLNGKGGPSTNFAKSEAGGILTTTGFHEYAEKELAFWVYQTRGVSKIYEFEGETEANNKEDHIESVIELQYGEVKTEHGITEAKEVLSTETGGTSEYKKTRLPKVLCPSGTTSCPESAGNKENAVHFQQSVVNKPTSKYSFSDELDKGTVYISEPAGTHSTASENTTTPEFEVEVENSKKEKEKQKRNNALYGSSNWLSEYKGAIQFIAKDPGIGVAKSILEYENAGKWEAVSGSEHNYLTEDLCKGVQCEKEQKEYWTLNPHLPNGEDKIRYRAEEAFGQETHQTESPESEAVGIVKVDTSKPRNVFIGGLPWGNELSEKPYKFTAYATDGEGSTIPSSGIASLAVYIENSKGEKKEIAKAGGSGTCSVAKGECTASAEYTLNGSELGAGHHGIVIVAKDNAGNEEREEETISIRHSTPVPLGPGDVDLESGDFTLGPSDVSLGSGLSVSRVYSSRDLTAGGEASLLGPQWSLSVGSEESLIELPDKSVMVTSGSGGQTIFAAIFNEKHEATGKFEAPPGDSNLTVTLEENGAKEKVAYYLKDPSEGTSTKFTYNSTTKVWLPETQEGPVPTDTVSYLYETVEVGGKKVTRPKEERGATPVAKLSCTPTMEPGCRALKFTYATKTKSAIGEGPTEWGEYEGHLSTISYEGYNPATKKMTGTPIPVAEYVYDKLGRLRAEWDPRISPALKTEYGYDTEGHVTALDPAGQEPWVFTYGTLAGDAGTGRLIKAMQAPTGDGLWNGVAVANTETPQITGTPTVGNQMGVSNGVWSGGPVAYSYQWEDCANSKGECTVIAGANNQNYTPVRSDTDHYLTVQVSATNGGGTVTTVTSPRTAVRVWGTPVPVFSLKYGTRGEGNGQFVEPHGIAVEGSHIWVADTGNGRVQQFTDTGGKIAFKREFGEQFGGNGNGCGEQQWLSKPYAIVAYKGDVWVGDAAPGDCVKEFNEEGKEVQEILGITGGVLGIAVDANGNVWYVVQGSLGSEIKIVEYNPTTKSQVRSWGTYGKEKGQIAGVRGIAVEHEHVFLTSEYKIQEFTETGTELTKFGTGGAGGWETTGGVSLALDPQGNIWSTGWEFGVKGYNEAGEFLTSFPESRPNPTAATVDSSGNFWLLEEEEGKGFTGFEEYTPGPKPTEGTKYSPQPGTTIDYDVPVSGAGAPHNMSASEVAKWGQKTQEAPVEATAILPPDSPQGWPASSYARANISYLDKEGRVVNTATPSTGAYGAISTAEYNETNDVVRTLSADDRAAALKETCEPEPNCASAKLAKLLSTENTYNGEGEKETEVPEPGTQLILSRGPEHMVKYVRGEEHYKAGEPVEEAMARSLTKYFYNEGAPAENPRTKKKEAYDLVTTTQDFAELINKEGKTGEITAESETKTGYSGQGDLGWQLRSPTSVTAAPGSQDLTSTTEYYESGEAMGQVEETRTPKGSGGKSAHDKKVVYYSKEENKEYKECGNHPEWAGLVCETLPAKQPETTGVPNLPVTKTTYNIWNEPETILEIFPKSGSFAEHTRTTKDEYDTAGRMKTSEETSTATTGTTDTALPKVTEEYNSTMGVLEKQSATVKEASGKEKAKTVTGKYNTLGQLESYTDADGNVAKFKYAGPEGDGLLEEMSDGSDEGNSSQKYTYSTATKQLEKLTDSAAGTFTASYDTEGKLASVVYPNGMCANYADNSVGEATGIEYVKSATCSEKSAGVWFSETKVPSIRGEVMSKTSTLAKEEYGYDTLGRLTEVHETPVGEYCKTRLYEYDKESNREKLITRAPNSKNECATTGGTEEKHTYDEANRLTDSGIAYDPLGNVTKLPSGDAEGHALESTFYVDNAVATQTQNGVTDDYFMDPAGRPRETITGAKKLITHYDGSGEAVAWTCEGSEKAETCESGGKWTRDIPGIDGTLTAVENGKGATFETPILQLHDLQGNVAATIKDKTGETKLESTYNSTEFGAPNGGKEPPKFAWLGAGGVEKSLASGVITEGATSYVPQTGLALQSEEVAPPGLPDGSGGEAATFTASAWNLQGAERVGAEAPGLEAGREVEAMEAALRAAVDPEKTTWFYITGAEETAKKLEGISNFQQWFEQLSVIFDVSDAASGAVAELAGSLGDAVSSYFNGWDTIEKWDDSTAAQLKKCAAEIASPNGRETYNEKHMKCGVEHDVLLSIGGFIAKALGNSEFQLVNFASAPKVIICTGHGGHDNEGNCGRVN